MISSDDLTAMRSTSTAALPDTCTVKRPVADGAGSLNTGTGVFTPSAGTTVYTGACRVRPAAGLTEVVAIFGDDQITQGRYVGTFPWNAPEFAVGDLVTITAGSDSFIDEGVFRVVRIGGGSWLIDRRVGLEVEQ